MLNKVSNLFWNAVTLVAALFVLDQFTGTSTATSLWEACWSAVWTAVNNPTNLAALLTVGAVLTILAAYDTIRKYVRAALASLWNDLVGAANSVADSVKPKGDESKTDA